MFNRGTDVKIDLDEFYDRLDRLNTTLVEIRDELNSLNTILELKKNKKVGGV